VGCLLSGTSTQWLQAPTWSGTNLRAKYFAATFFWWGEVIFQTKINFRSSFGRDKNYVLNIDSEA
jgi:hypothetical protein